MPLNGILYRMWTCILFFLFFCFFLRIILFSIIWFWLVFLCFSFKLTFISFILFSFSAIRKPFFLLHHLFHLFEWLRRLFSPSGLLSDLSDHYILCATAILTPFFLLSLLLCQITECFWNPLKSPSLLKNFL